MATTSFAQLFIIKRILAKNPRFQNVSILFDKSEKDEQGMAIIASLCKMRLKQYLEQEYKEDQRSAITLLFNKIVSMYPAEYQSVLAFHDHKEKTRVYERKLFNQLYLVPQIFQHLDLSELNNCCLVNSIWMYHGYNINSIYSWNSLDWHRFYERSKTDGSKQKQIPGHQRFCQRLINCKKIVHLGWTQKTDIPKLFVDLYKSLNIQNLRWVDVELSAYQTDNEKEIVDIVCENTRKLEFFSCGVITSMLIQNERCDALSKNIKPIYLDNAKHVEIIGLLLPIVVTNKCEKLKLRCVEEIHENWVKHVIDNSDLTRVNTLVLEKFGFELNEQLLPRRFVDIVGERTREIKVSSKMIDAFAHKFINLKYLEIGRGVSYRDTIGDTLLFWKSLQPIISKNDTVIQLNLGSTYCNLKKLLDFVSDYKFYHNLKYLVLDVNCFCEKAYEHLLTIPEIQDNVEKLHLKVDNQIRFDQLFCLGKANEDNQQWQYRRLDSSIKFKSLMAVTVWNMYEHDCSLSHVIGFFECQLQRGIQQCMFFDTQFSVSININNQCSIADGNKQNDTDTDFEANLYDFFELMLKMVEQQIALNVNVIFCQPKRGKNRYENINQRKIKEATKQEVKRKVNKLYNRYYEQFFQPVFGKYIRNGNDSIKTPKIGKFGINGNSENSKCAGIKIPDAKCNKYCHKATIPKILLTANNDKQISTYGIRVMKFTVETARAASNPF